MVNMDRLKICSSWGKRIFIQHDFLLSKVSFECQSETGGDLLLQVSVDYLLLAKFHQKVVLSKQVFFPLLTVHIKRDFCPKFA